MATVIGGHKFQLDARQGVSDAVAKSTNDPTTNLSATPVQTFPLPASMTSAGAAGSHDTVPGGDSSSVFSTSHASFAAPSPQPIGGTDPVVATQGGHTAGVTVHFTDGSSLTVVGISHLSGGFFHH